MRPGGSADSPTPPPSDTTAYSQRVGSTHPAVMHSCFEL